MKKLMALILMTVLFAACGEQHADVPVIQEKQPWAEFAAQLISDYYQRNPQTAVDAGLHEFDGQMSDASAPALKKYGDWLEAARAQAAGYTELQGTEAFERDYLKAALAGQLFWLRESGFPTSNPMFYVGKIQLSVYVDREYAPPAERMKAYTAYVAQIPELLQQMQRNLQTPLPAPYVEISHGVLSGLIGYLDKTVPGIFSVVADAALQEKFMTANTAATEAVRQAADWLEDQKATATDDYALGEERFLKMLNDSQGVNITLAALKAAGQRDLDRNLRALDTACAEYAPDKSIKECVLKMQNHKPAEGAVAAARRQLPSLRKFVEDKQLVTIPGTEEALVDEAPPHRRFNAAYINIPGPFESGLPSVYYIAPPDPEWSEEDQLAYIPGEMDLLSISVHEVWPGHFLQYLHSNRVDNNVGRHFSTYTFGEGWAHYAEQMMVDAGLGAGDPEVRIGQLLNALLRNVRYLSAIGLHAEGMTVAESQAMFEEKAFQDHGNAAQQALRGTYDPGYLNYTLGKLMINKLRADWTSGRGGREAWRSFHDKFLSYGSPPIPLIRKQMLGEDYTGDAALLPP